MTASLSAAPPAIVEALTRLKDDLLRAAGKNLAGLILYGGLARGRYRPGKSDVNIVVLLHEVSAEALTAIAPALRIARRAAGITPMIIMPAEVAPTAVVFPTKFLDIKEHHVVLHGDDPFTGLDVPSEQIRLRIVQQLRNLSMRVRLRFLAALDNRDLLTATLSSLARPLAVELAALLRLAGKEVPRDDRTAAIFQAAATAFGVDGDGLARLAAFRQGEPVADDLSGLVTRLMTTLSRLIDSAERLKEGRG